MASNRYPGTCCRCGKSVAPKEGYLLGDKVTCRPCVPAARDRSATISPRGTYRYRLERPLFEDGDGSVAVLMVNPSTADATQDDPTITRIQRRFLKKEYLGKLLPRPRKVIVGNLFAYRATDVKELARAFDPVGPDNDNHLWQIVNEADRVVYAWGPLNKLPPALRNRWREVHGLVMASCRHIPSIIGPPAADGQPRHPLMLSYDLPLEPWRVPLAASCSVG